MTEISDGVLYCGRADKERRLFDQIMPIPQGTTYNSYIVKGEKKNVLIDTMYAKFVDAYMDDIVASGIRIDAVVSNHAEPDHSGAIPSLLEKFPEARVYCTKKCAENLRNFLGISLDRVEEVSDGQTLDLGGRTLEFIHAPWVHWPDTMFTHLREDNFLFTCDFFGAHWTKGIIADNSTELAEAAKGYYAEIMMPFRNFCVKYLEKVERLSPKLVLPSHGPIYKDPSFICNLYSDWTSPSVARKVIIAYVSMYGSSETMAKELAELLEARNIRAVLADIIETDECSIAKALVDSAGIVFSTPMVLASPHPKSVYVAELANILRPKLKFYSVMGSFGWGGNLSAAIDACFTLTKPKKIEGLTVKGLLLGEDRKKLGELADRIAEQFSE